MKNNLDGVAFFSALTATLLTSFIAASIYQLNLKDLFQSGFWGAPVYFFVFFCFVGYPVYAWVRYFRIHTKRKSSATAHPHFD